MHRYQQLIKQDHAISPIIGVVLMIALLVAIAATVIIYVNMTSVEKLSASERMIDSLNQQLKDQVAPPDNPEDLQNPPDPPEDPPEDPPKQGGSWWDESWEYRKSITIDHTILTDDLTHYPILLSIKDSDLSKAQPDGDDIVFTLDDHETQLNHEIEYFNSANGELVAWIEIPQLSSTVDTTLYMYYGNGVCGSQQHSDDVWDSNYVLVHHLEETAGEIDDSSSYDNDGTAMGGLRLDAPGKIDGADEFDLSGSYIEVTNAASLENYGNSISIEGWFKYESIISFIPLPIVEKGERIAADLNYDGVVDEDDFVIIQKHFLNPDNGGDRYPSPYPPWDIGHDTWCDILDVGALGHQFGQSNPVWAVYIVENKLRFTLSGTDAILESSTSFTEDDVDQWFHFAAIYDGTASYLYINGVLDNSTENSGSIDATATSLKIGKSEMVPFIGPIDILPYYMDGVLDEIRISNTPRSQAWIETSYTNQMHPSSCFTIGDEES